MPFSHWEKNSWLDNRDVLIAGGGIVGISTALLIKRKRPEWKVSVVDPDPFGGGGSTKNAGFACFGSPSELLSDRETLGDEGALNLVAMRLEGLKALREWHGDEALGFLPCGSHELTLSAAHMEGDLGIPVTTPAVSPEQIDELNRWLQSVTHSPQTFEVCDPKMLVGIDERCVTQAVHSPLEGSIDTGRMMRHLLREAASLGVDFIRGVRVGGIADGASAAGRPFCLVGATAGATGQVGGTGAVGGEVLYSGRARHVVVATNAMAKELLPELDVVPALNHVLVTDHVPGLKARGTYHLESGYVYARELNGRMLIGGGRHWKWDDRRTMEVLEKLMNRVWPETRGVGIGSHWTGILGVGEPVGAAQAQANAGASRQPIVKTLSPGLHVGVKMGGMGVAIGSVIGRKLAKMVLACE